jgi:1,3-beta-glucan synthase
VIRCADDYYRSAECQNKIEPVQEGMYLHNAVKPMYRYARALLSTFTPALTLGCLRFIREQGYELQDGKYVWREKDRKDIIGYDDINQLFWYPEGIGRIVLTNKVHTHRPLSPYVEP